MRVRSVSPGVQSRDPTLRAVACGRVSQEQRSGDGHDEKDRAEDSEGRRKPIAGDQDQLREWSEDGGARAVATDCQAHCETPLVGEPFGHDRNRCGVAEAVAQAADDAETYIEVIETVCVGREIESEAHQDAAC